MEHSLGRHGEMNVELSGPFMEKVPIRSRHPYMSANWGDPETYPLRWISNTKAEFRLNRQEEVQRLLELMAAAGVLYGIDLYIGPAIDFTSSIERDTIVLAPGRRVGLYIDPNRIELYLKASSLEEPTPQEVRESEPQLFAEELEIAKLRLDPAFGILQAAA